MKNKVGIIKQVTCLGLIFLLSINSFAAIVSDNDGSAFITKAEFDALKSSFQSQIDSYNQSIDSKIDGAIASYLAGIKISSYVDLPNMYNDLALPGLISDGLGGGIPWRRDYSKCSGAASQTTSLDFYGTTLLEAYDPINWYTGYVHKIYDNKKNRFVLKTIAGQMVIVGHQTCDWLANMVMTDVWENSSGSTSITGDADKIIQTIWTDRSTQAQGIKNFLSKGKNGVKAYKEEIYGVLFVSEKTVDAALPSAYGLSPTSSTVDYCLDLESAITWDSWDSISTSGSTISEIHVPEADGVNGIFAKTTSMSITVKNLLGTATNVIKDIAASDLVFDSLKSVCNKNQAIKNGIVVTQASADGTLTIKGFVSKESYMIFYAGLDPDANWAGQRSSWETAANLRSGNFQTTIPVTKNDYIFVVCIPKTNGNVATINFTDLVLEQAT